MTRTARDSPGLIAVSPIYRRTSIAVIMLAYAKPGSLTCRRPGLQQQLPASRSAISFRVLSQKSGIIVHSGGRQSPAVLRATESTESASALDRQPSTSYASRRESTEVPAPRDRPWKRVLGKLAKAAAVGGLCFALVRPYSQSSGA